MKRLTVFFGLLITSYSCTNLCSDRPDPKLTQEAQQWIEPYRAKPLFIYQTQPGNRDTLLVRYKTETEYCGGDECGSQCEIQRATLISKRDSTLRITIEAKLNDVVAINYSSISLPNSNLLYAKIYLRSRITDQWPTAAQISYTTNYTFGSELLTVIQANCESANECQGLKMPLVLVSKEKGLLGYTDRHNQRWTLTN